MRRGSTGLVRVARHCATDPVPGPDAVKNKGRWTSHEGTGARGAGWRYALVKIVEDPSKYMDQVIHVDAEVLVMKDKFPKAKTHLLVLPRQRIDSIYDLRKEHVPVVEAMRSFGQQIADAESDAKGVELRMGFHAVPSMVQLHMHMVSDDFDSEFLKHKKHWNSFTTEFFIEPDTLIKEIEENGAFSGKEHYEDILKQQLKCHRCGSVLSNMPKLKQHILHCR